MINQNVIDGLTWLYSIFDIKLLTVIATGFTIYFGYQKTTTKACVSFRISSSRVYPPHVNNLVISNKRDNTLVISSINLGIGNKGQFQLVQFDEPLVLKGYEAKLVDVPKYSEISNDSGPVEIGILEPLSFSLITMSGRIIECEVESPLTLDGMTFNLYKSTSNFNKIVLTNRMGFIFSYFVDDVREDIVIDRHGFITGKTPFKYNMFGNITAESFRTFLVDGGYHEYYENYALYKVNDNLSTDMILSKAMVKSYVESN